MSVMALSLLACIILEKEINYMSERIKSLSITSENGFVLIPTDNDSIKRLDDVLNVKGNSEMLSNITSNFSVPENIHAMAVKIDQKADDLIKT